MKLGQKTWKECGNEIIRFYGKRFISKEYNNMLIGLINQVECNKGGKITINLSDGKMLLKLLRKLIFDELTNNISKVKKYKLMIMKYNAFEDNYEYEEKIIETNDIYHEIGYIYSNTLEDIKRIDYKELKEGE